MPQDKKDQHIKRNNEYSKVNREKINEKCRYRRKVKTIGVINANQKHKENQKKLVDNMPHARIAAEFKEFKAEVAAANLREEPHAQPCPCAWCRLERDNQGETMSELTRAVMTADPAVIAEAAWQAIQPSK